MVGGGGSGADRLQISLLLSGEQEERGVPGEPRRSREAAGRGAGQVARGGRGQAATPQPPAQPAVPPSQRGGVPEEGDQAPPSTPSPSALARRVFTVAGVERARSHDRAMRARQVYPEEEGLAGCSPRDAPHHSFYKRGEEFDRLANIPGADYKTNHPGSIPQTAPAPALGERDACLGRAAIAGSCR